MFSMLILIFFTWAVNITCNLACTTLEYPSSITQRDPKYWTFRNVLKRKHQLSPWCFMSFHVTVEPPPFWCKTYRTYHMKGQLSCHPFWCKPTLTVLSYWNNLRSKFCQCWILDSSTCYCCSYFPDQYNQTENNFKAELLIKILP